MPNRTPAGERLRFEIVESGTVCNVKRSDDPMLVALLVKHTDRTEWFLWRVDSKLSQQESEQILAALRELNEGKELSHD
jgi:hypothetical protein